MPPSTALIDARVRQLSALANSSAGSVDPANPPSQSGDNEQNQGNTMGPSNEQPSTLANLLDMVLQSPPKHQGKLTSSFSASSLVAVGEGLPLIPKKLVEKIQAGEYIDFSELPPAKGKARSLPPHWEGHILVVQLEDLEGSKRLIPDFQTWVQCFAIYAATVVIKHPEKFSSLMAYMTDMAKNARKYKWPSWVVYDQNFRMHMASPDCRNELVDGELLKHLYAVFSESGNNPGRTVV